MVKGNSIRTNFPTLQEVIMDEDIKEMVRQTLYLQGGTKCPYEPKLTRAKIRWVFASLTNRWKTLLNAELWTTGALPSYLICRIVKRMMKIVFSKWPTLPEYPNTFQLTSIKSNENFCCCLFAVHCIGFEEYNICGPVAWERGRWGGHCLFGPLICPSSWRAKFAFIQRLLNVIELKYYVLLRFCYGFRFWKRYWVVGTR